jgi:hypothetical protein
MISSGMMCMVLFVSCWLLDNPIREQPAVQGTWLEPYMHVTGPNAGVVCQPLSTGPPLPPGIIHRQRAFVLMKAASSTAGALA